MKRIMSLYVWALALMMLIMPACKAKAQGIEFIDYKTTTMQAVLDKAKAEHKYVFVDIWTPWCGVCKMMARLIFPRQDVGDYFNKNFINLTFDAENAKWTQQAFEYNATAFPTMLIVNDKGEVVCNLDNLGVPQQDDKTSAKSAVADRLMYQARMAVEWDTMSDSAFVSKANWEKLSDMEPAFDTRVYSRLINLKDTLMKLYPGQYERLMRGSLSSAASNCMNSVNHRNVPHAHKVAQYRQVVERLNRPDKASTLLDLDLNIAINMRQWQKALDLVKSNESAMTPMLYLTVMEGFAYSCSDKALLRQAATVTSKALQMKMSDRDRKYVTEAYEQLKKN